MSQENKQQNEFVEGLKKIGGGFIWGAKIAAPIAGAVFAVGLAVAVVDCIRPNK